VVAVASGGAALIPEVGGEGLLASISVGSALGSIYGGYTACGENDLVACVAGIGFGVIALGAEGAVALGLSAGTDELLVASGRAVSIVAAGSGAVASVFDIGLGLGQNTSGQATSGSSACGSVTITKAGTVPVPQPFSIGGIS
jgi:hypothetical protein